MELVKDYPPNYEEIKKHFDIEGKEILFCFGDKLYNPSGKKITADLMIHEMTHERQQQGKPKEWWEKYLADDKFRLEQEIEAYAMQYKFIKQVSSAKRSAIALSGIATSLSSEIYGNMISYHQAHSLIRHKVK